MLGRVSLLIFLLVYVPIACAFEFKRLAGVKWVQYQSKNFLLVTDLKEEKARYLVEDLESFHYFLTDIMGVRVSPELPPLPILGIGNYRSLADMGLPTNIGGVFKVDRTGYAAIANATQYEPGNESSDISRHTLLHEYFHFLTFFSEHQEIVLPGWYIEGMAEYWATYRREEDEVLVGDPTAISDRIFDLFSSARGKYLIDTRALMSQDIPDLTDDSENGKVALSRFYARSFFLTHYLNSNPKLRDQTAAYIKRVNEGLEKEEAFIKAFNASHEDLDKALHDYIVNSKMLARRFYILDSNKKGFEKPEIKKQNLDKAERYRFIATLLWDFKLPRISLKEREAMLKLAIKKNKGDENLKMFLRFLEAGEMKG